MPRISSPTAKPRAPFFFKRLLQNSDYAHGSDGACNRLLYGCTDPDVGEQYTQIRRVCKSPKYDIG